MTTGTQELGPPEAPPFARRLQFARLQLVGMPLIMLVPLLSLFGLFGDVREAREVVEHDTLVRVDHERRARQGARSRLAVSVRNVGQAARSGARVELARALLDTFDEVRVNSPVDRIVGDAHVVQLGELAPGATRAVIVEFRPAQRGALRGQVRVFAGEGRLVDVPLEMFVLP